MPWSVASSTPIPNMFVPVFVAVIVVIVLYKILQKDKINLPGPTPLPLLGNILQITPDRPHQTFEKWHKDYNRVFKMYQLRTPVVVVGSYEGMQEVLVKKGKDFSGRPRTYRFGLWGESHPWQDGIVVSQPDTTWKMLRMSAQKHVKQFDDGMKRIEDAGTEICADMLDNFASHQGEPFKPGKYITNAVMNNLTLFLLGKKFKTDDKLFQLFLEINNLIQELFSSVGPHALIDTFPWLKYFGNKTEYRIKGAMEKRNQLYMQMKEEISTKSSDVSADREGNLLETYLRMLQNPLFVGGEPRIRCAAANMILAGAQTSKSTFMAFVNIITHYKEVYAKLQVEVDESLGDRLPSFADRDNMPYTKATMFELLRYTSIVPFTVPHMALQDTSLGGAFIPKGTMVLINQWSAFHDESYWPEPFEFRPERFLDESGQLLPVDHEVRRRLMAFGAGPRVCIGEQFALGRLFLLITSMIQKFEIEQPEPKVSCDPRDYELAFILTPPDFKVTMKPRKGKDEERK